eukprot:6182675-Amphidinium_carterae.1
MSFHRLAAAKQHQKNKSRGLRTMSAVTTFAIYRNSFEGVLPGSVLQGMRAVSIFYINENVFKG